MAQIALEQPVSYARRLAPGLLSILFLTASSLVYSPPSAAIGGFKPTPEERAVLPPYCGPRAETWGNDPSRPEVAQWVGVFGKDYMHMHHYCSALLDIFHAQTAMDDANQNRLYRRAMSDIEYMEARVSTGFVLWPDMLHNRARIERAQGNTGAAVHSLQQAITRKADYPPPYAELADIHVSLGQQEEARKVLEAGLAQQPNSRLLLRKMSCLDDRNAPGCR